MVSGKLVVDPFDACKPFPDLAVDGKQTLSENIADTASLAIAYETDRISLGGHEAPIVDGFTRTSLVRRVFDGRGRHRFLLDRMNKCREIGP